MRQSSAVTFPMTALAIAVGALVLASVAWFAIVNAAPGPMTHGAALSALCLLAIAFLPLGRLATWRPWAPVRIALGIATVFSVLDAMSMPAPLRAESVSSFVAFFFVVVLAVTAQLLAEPRPRLAFLALVGLAAFGLYFGYAVDYYATSPHFGPRAKYSSWPVAMIGIACVAACWHGRFLVRSAVRSHPVAAR